MSPVPVRRRAPPAHQPADRLRSVEVSDFHQGIRRFADIEPPVGIVRGGYGLLPLEFQGPGAAPRTLVLTRIDNPVGPGLGNARLTRECEVRYVPCHVRLPVQV
jgi:hypothetical protein